MYNNLVLYRNELKNKSIPKYKIVGILTEMILSKEIFSNNKEVSIFLKDVFKFEFKDYVIKSRVLIVSKVSKKLLEDIDISYRNKLVDFINEQIRVLKVKNNIKEKRNEFDGWINKI